MNFNNDLIYSGGVKPYMNNHLIENNIYEFDEKNKQIYNKFKQSSRLGLHLPVKIVYDKNQGYVVKALKFISINTLICEYVGDVFFLRNKLLNKNNSIMALIFDPIYNLSLVICPEKLVI